MYTFCTFLLQLAPSVLAIGMYQHFDQKLQVQKWVVENQEKQNVSYDECTTLLKDKIALLEHDIHSLHELVHRVGLATVTLSVVFTFLFGYLF